MVASLIVLLQTLFGGFLASRVAFPSFLKWLPYLSFVRYGFEALLINEFHGATGFRYTAENQPTVDPDHVPHVDVDGDYVLHTFGFNPREGVLDILGLFVCLLVSMVVIYISLYLKSRRSAKKFWF